VLIGRYLGLAPAEIAELPDEEWTERAAQAVWLQEQEHETFRAAINQALHDAFGSGR
jgi:hypothetical protein